MRMASMPFERLDGSDEHGRRLAFGSGDDVEAVIHPVDKVHVGDARPSEHDPVPSGLAKPGVRRLVVASPVRLDFDDPAGPPTAGVVADQASADQCSGGSLGRCGEDGAVDGAQTRG